ncbi:MULTISPECIES: YciI family protein [unclassified Leifsonia]|uniref:YciI family protein n=1 Tax=unclassified Leifsonia TaxID=2663824 RepID=UPI000AE1088B|nr:MULTISPECIES: YciI family protein [unclassified Leifsonia]
MKYLILIKSNPEWAGAFASFTPEQQAEGMALYEKLFSDLQESGELVDAEQLAAPETARVVSIGADGPVASDGPFVEAKEWFGGYYIVDVDTLDRAVEIAGRLPEARNGMVSVHPVMASAGMEL